MRPDFPDTSADAVDWLFTANGYSVAWSRDGDAHVAVASSPAGQRHKSRRNRCYRIAERFASLNSSTCGRHSS